MECILFDLDGTIQDSEKLAAEANSYGFQSVLGRKATQEELDYLVGKAVSKVIAVMFPEQGKLIIEKCVEHYLQFSHDIQCYAGVEELIKGLSTMGYPLGIVSSKTRRNVLLELESKSLLHLFQCIVGQEDTNVHKPNPEPLLLAAKLMGYPPEQCIYIGDLPTDMIAASEAGMKSAAALWGEGRLERLAPTSPSYIFDTPHSALELFKKMANEHTESVVKK